MDLDPAGAPARGLRRYVALVAGAVGVGAEAAYVQIESPVDVYIPLDQRLRLFPKRDAALLWDEQYGWALAVETHGGADLLVLGYLGAEVLPSPRTVAGHLQRAVEGTALGMLDPPGFRDSKGSDGLSQRLAGYAEPIEWFVTVGAATAKHFA